MGSGESAAAVASGSSAGSGESAATGSAATATGDSSSIRGSSWFVSWVKCQYAPVVMSVTTDDALAWRASIPGSCSGAACSLVTKRLGAPLRLPIDARPRATMGLSATRPG